MGYLASTASGKQSNVNTSFDLVHTTHANVNCLVVTIGAVDDGSIVVSSVVINGGSYTNESMLPAAAGNHAVTGGDYIFAGIYYITANLAGSTQYTITVNFNAKTTNADAVAIDLDEIDTSDVWEDADIAVTETAQDTTGTTSSGDFTIGQLVSYNSSPNTTVDTGTEVSDVDLGDANSVSAYVDQALEISWNDSNSSETYGHVVSFNESAGLTTTAASKFFHRQQMINF